MTRELIAGIGLRRDCPAQAIVSLIEAASARTGRRPAALAAPAFKAHEPGLRTAAAQLGLPLILLDPAALAATQGRCPTRSSRAAAAVGFASVAEGCALAAAGEGGTLVLPRIAGGGATCAIAEAGEASTGNGARSSWLRSRRRERVAVHGPDAA